MKPGRQFTTYRTSLSFLIVGPYGLQASQITNGPDWVTTDKFPYNGHVAGREGSTEQRAVEDHASETARGPLPAQPPSRQQRAPYIRARSCKNRTQTYPKPKQPKRSTRLRCAGISNLMIRNTSMADFCRVDHRHGPARCGSDSNLRKVRFHFELDARSVSIPRYELEWVARRGPRIASLPGDFSSNWD